MAAAELILHDRIYRDIKVYILSGVSAMGARLSVPDLARRHNSSVTPVREALYRLVGEDLIDLIPQGGFQLRSINAVGLTHLYQLNRHILAACVRSRIMSDLMMIPKHDEAASTEMLLPGYGVAELFSAISCWSDNREMTSLIGRVNDRLAHVRRIEIQVLRNVHEEMRSIYAVISSGDTTKIIRVLDKYHNKRINKSALIAAFSASYRSG